jgi:hypothetical protein
MKISIPKAINDVMFARSTVDTNLDIWTGHCFHAITFRGHGTAADLRSS